MGKLSAADFAVFVLRCLLNYHVRMMAGSENVRIETIEETGPEGYTVRDLYAGWSEALKEAIRCVMIVHAGEVKSFPEWEKWVDLQADSDSPAVG